MTESRMGRRLDSSLNRLAPTNPFNATVALAVGFALLLVSYLFTGFLPLLLLLVALAVVGADRIVRLHPQARFHGATATMLYLFVPGLFALGAGLLLGELGSTIGRLLATLAVTLVFLITVRTEYLTVDPDAETYDLARILLLYAIYLTAFFLFVVVFVAALPVWLGMALVAGTSFLLTVDIMRELEADSTTLWVQSGAVAAVMAECRLALYYLAIADVLAGAFMLIAFYVMTGLIQNQTSGRLDRGTLVMYAAVATAGLLLVLIGRIL